MIHGDREDTIWLAGLLEGEGTFDLHRGRYPRVRLGMTDRDVVGRAASLLDASIRLSLHAAPAKPTWHTEISGARAAEVMRAILPHMGARRSQKIATILANVQCDALGASHAPGPKLARPAGLAKPATAA
jgi:hypothetical protein